MIATTTATPFEAVAYAMEHRLYAPMIEESAENRSAGAVITYRRVCEVSGARAELGVIILLSGFPGAVNGWFCIRSTCDTPEKERAELELKRALEEFVAGLRAAAAHGRN